MVERDECATNAAGAHLVLPPVLPRKPGSPSPR
jgi:hypothetical protein